MIKFYYVSITDRNLYIDDINLLEYLKNYFPNIYTYYKDMVKKSDIVNFDKYKESRMFFNRKLEEEGLSFYLLIRKKEGELREINTNSPLVGSNIKKPKLKELTREELDKLKELTREELETLYTDDYIKRTNKYFYLPFALDNNPIFDLDYEEEKEKFKIIKKTN